MPRVVAVNPSNFYPLVLYGREYGPEHDESFLPGRDYDLSPEYPSYLLLEDKEVIGAVSLMRTARYESVGKGRFAIFHTRPATPEAYAALLEATRAHFAGLRSVYLFLPDDRRATADILRELGFHIERYSYVLRHLHPERAEIQLPAGFAIVSLEATDEALIRQFADLINQNFASLAGHTHSTPEFIQGWFRNETYLPGGICLLLDHDRAIGTLCVSRMYNDMHTADISGLSVSPPYRGQGFGRRLLGYAANIALGQGLRSMILSVNAENESALRLYQSEGYTLAETMVCFAMDCAG